MTQNVNNSCFFFDKKKFLIYLLLQVYDKNRAFKFLEHIKNKFESQYQRRVHTALPFAFHAEFQSTLALETVGIKLFLNILILYNLKFYIKK